MARKRSPTTRNAEPPRINDLKLINGIGPAVEKRLNGVGIFTFAQLAALSPADIAAAVAGIAGLSAERIIKQDWIGQARKLAAGVLASEAPQDTVIAVEQPTPVEERAPAVEEQSEPEQPGEVAVESQASEAPQDIVTSAATPARVEERVLAAEQPAELDELEVESPAGEAREDTMAAVETLAPVEEYASAAERQLEPEQPGEVAVESLASEAQMDVEASAVTEQIVTIPTPVEPPQVPGENTHEVAPLAQREMGALPLEERYQPVTFTVELLLDENNRVYSTRAMHIQSGQEQTWTGWQEAQLVGFLSKSAGINITPEEPAFSDVEVTASEPPTSIAASEQDAEPNIVPEEPALPGTEAPGQVTVVATESGLLTPVTESSRLAGTLRVRDIETLRAGSSSPSRLLSSNEPFDVHLTLDLTELQVPGTTSLNYKASIFGKSRGTGSHAGLVGEAQGTIIPDDTATINVKGNTLPEGVYQLAATVILGLPGRELTPRPGTTATINGGRVQVYQAF